MRGFYSVVARATQSRVFSALLTVSTLTAIVKVAGAAKVLFIAHQFGIRDDLDAFFIAILLPSFFADVSAASTTAALIPTMVEAREKEGPEAARRLAAGITLWTLLLLSAAMLFASFLSGPLIGLLASGFQPAKLELTRQLFLGLLPILVLSGLGATWRAILNAQHDYALAAAVPVITPLATIVAVVAGAGRWGASALVIGSLAGALLEVLCLSLGLARHGLLVMPRLAFSDRATRTVIRQYVPMLGSSLVFSASNLVSQSMAATLGSGSVSALNYGSKLVNVILAIGPASIGTAALPHFARIVTRGGIEEAWSAFRSYVRPILLFTIPLTALLIAASEPIARILYQRGEFTSQNTHLVATVQRFYLIQLPMAMLVALGTRMVSSLKANDTLLWGSLIAVAVQGILTAVLLKPLGITGVALAASGSVLIYLCYLLVVLLRWNRAKIAATGKGPF